MQQSFLNIAPRHVYKKLLADRLLFTREGNNVYFGYRTARQLFQLAVKPDDVINDENNTTANFLVGSSSFSVVNGSARVSLQAGVGVKLQLARHLQVKLDYDFEYRNGFNDNPRLIKCKYIF